MKIFLEEVQSKYRVNVRYLQEFVELGTAGGIYHFRDQIRAGNPEFFFLLNGDVYADFPLKELYDFHQSKKGALISILSTEADKETSKNYGCIVTDKTTGEVLHYVEKPNSYVSPLINTGVYIVSTDIFPQIATVFYSRPKNDGGNGSGKDQGHIQLEQEVLSPLAGTQKLFTLTTSDMKWAQVKNAASAIYANRQALEFLKRNNPERFSGCTIIDNVFIHHSAQIDPTAVLGPNVSIGKGVVIKAGVRIRESIVLDNSIIEDHTLVIHSIIGRNSKVGMWSRIEGSAVDPDPNKPFAKIKNLPLFNREGKINPSTTILGFGVSVKSELILLNSIVLPSKEITRSFKNEIIL